MPLNPFNSNDFVTEFKVETTIFAYSLFFHTLIYYYPLIYFEIYSLIKTLNSMLFPQPNPPLKIMNPILKNLKITAHLFIVFIAFIILFIASFWIIRIIFV